MDKIIILIPIFFAFGYLVFYIIDGPNSNPTSFRYNLLFERNYFLKQLLFTIFFFLIGILRYKSHPFDVYYIAPLIFILQVKLINPIFRRLYNRNIIIAIKGSRPARGKNGIKVLDKIIGFLIFMISIMVPFIIIMIEKSNNHINKTF